MPFAIAASLAISTMSTGRRLKCRRRDRGGEARRRASVLNVDAFALGGLALVLTRAYPNVAMRLFFPSLTFVAVSDL